MKNIPLTSETNHKIKNASGRNFGNYSLEQFQSVCNQTVGDLSKVSGALTLK